MRQWKWIVGGVTRSKTKVAVQRKEIPWSERLFLRMEIPAVRTKNDTLNSLKRKTSGQTVDSGPIGQSVQVFGTVPKTWASDRCIRRSLVLQWSQFEGWRKLPRNVRIERLIPTAHHHKRTVFERRTAQLNWHFVKMPFAFSGLLHSNPS